MLREFGSNEVWFLVMAARWTVLLSLVAFVGGVLVMGGSFLIRTHLRDYDNPS